MSAPAVEYADAQQSYICRRVVDALLREDVRACRSRARLVREAAPAAAVAAGPCLVVEHWEAGRLWIPVRPGGFLQDWCVRALPLVWQDDVGEHAMYDVNAILGCWRRGLPPEQAQAYSRFAAECQLAIAHGRLCRGEQQRYLRVWRARSAELDCLPWERRLLHYERLAAFHDHPLYPTARAKPAFTARDVQRYGPEFQVAFRLRWLAVPRAGYHGNCDDLPDFWPRCEQVGLPAGAAADYVLLPVHPMVWDRHLATLLRELADAAGGPAAAPVLRAPRAYLSVMPTLSVRTVVVLEAPHWHLKLPLPICTLGASNLRTIKPSTRHDGQAVQDILAHVVEREPAVASLLLTDESRSGQYLDHPWLGFILRRYPPGLEHSTLVPVAAAAAPAPEHGTVFEALARRFRHGAVLDLFADYVHMSLRLHLLLWLRYGIALEANQQNSVLVFADQEPGLRLLLKDNDAARIFGARLIARCPALAPAVDGLRDRRIVVQHELPLAQMFTTIALQLNIAAVAEGLAAAGHGRRRLWYQRIRDQIEDLLAEYAAQGEAVGLARRVLLEDEHLYVKYLLRAASLEGKARTGAADVNKFYGKSAPNFLLPS